jgi:hypothetical protein
VVRSELGRRAADYYPLEIWGGGQRASKGALAVIF